MSTVLYIRPNFIDQVLRYFEEETTLNWATALTNLKEFFLVFLPLQRTSKYVHNAVKICVEEYERQSKPAKRLFGSTYRLQQSASRPRALHLHGTLGRTRYWRNGVAASWFHGGYFDLERSNLNVHDMRRWYRITDMTDRDYYVKRWYTRYSEVSRKRGIYLIMNMHEFIKREPGSHYYYVTENYSWERDFFEAICDDDEINEEF